MIDRSVVFTCMNALYMLMLHKNAIFLLKRQQGRCCGFWFLVGGAAKYSGFWVDERETVR
jgi:hypothetical protein